MTQSPTFLSTVEQIMDAHVPVIYADEPVSTVRSLADYEDDVPVAVVETDGTFCGLLAPNAVMVDSVSTARTLATRSRMTVAPNEGAFAVISRMLNRRVEWVPVIDRGKFAGAITRRCVRRAFGETYSG